MESRTERPSDDGLPSFCGPAARRAWWRGVAACGCFVLLTSLVCGASADDWWSRSKVTKTKYYMLKTDLPSDEARNLANHMDATHASYVRTFSRLPIRLKRRAALGLFLFAKQEDYLTTLPKHFRTDGTGSWGKCITRGDTISLVGFRGSHTVEQVKPLLQHEGFHQFASQLFPGMPTWANEGMAEVFERGVVVGGQLMLGEFTDQDRARLVAAIDNGTAMSVRELLQLSSGRWNAQVAAGDASVQYLQAWSLVHFFLFAEQRQHRDRFLSFLVQLNANGSWRRSFVSTFGMLDWDELHRRWEQHVRNYPKTDIRSAVRVLVYLSDGMQALREDHVYPSTSAQLLEALSKKDFQQTKKLYDQSVRITSEHPMVQAWLAEPDSESNEPQVQLKFQDSRGRPPRAGYSRRGNPPPLDLVTKGLPPGNLTVRWKRRGKRFSYTVQPAK